jgi:hypothetical protein
MQNTCRLTDPLGTGGLFHDGSLLNGNEGKGANVSGNSQSKAIQPNKGFDIYAGPPWQIARTGSVTNDQGSHHFRSPNPSQQIEMGINRVAGLRA